MTSIENILKPKSKDDLTEEIRQMTTFEYLEAFTNHSSKELKSRGIKIGFKKSLFEFLIGRKHTGIMKVYSIYIMIWFSLLIFGIITKHKFEVIENIENIFLWVLYGFWFPLLAIQLIIKRRYAKFVQKILDGKYRVQQRQVMERFGNDPASQEMIGQVFGMFRAMGVPAAAIQTVIEPQLPQDDEHREHTETEE